MITKNEYKAIIQLDELINVKIWNGAERRFILGMYRHAINHYNSTLTRLESDMIFRLKRKYFPEKNYNKYVKKEHPKDTRFRKLTPIVEN